MYTCPTKPFKTHFFFNPAKADTNPPELPLNVQFPSESRQRVMGSRFDTTMTALETCIASGVLFWGKTLIILRSNWLDWSTGIDNHKSPYLLRHTQIMQNGSLNTTTRTICLLRRLEKDLRSILQILRPVDKSVNVFASMQ